MAKVYFRYAAMNAGKSTQLLQVRHNYHERHQRTLLLKPELDDRDGVGLIRPRIGGLEVRVDALVQPGTDLRALVEADMKTSGRLDCILIDEAQFLSPQQVRQLCDVADFQDIPVMAYGLRADFRGELFPGSAALMALADAIEELKTICWCGRKATVNARIQDGHVQYEGPQILIGGNEAYTALCRKHWRLDQPVPPGARFD
ncbi:MAG: Thymidine kinase [Acidobacteria bacterium ADurb.Bin340]|nr:MAG: Thymidine kinase [Acidobacteria bacterium ADurb.Bin340]